MPSSPRTLAVHVEAPWLPPGGRAEVVLAEGQTLPPTPTCMVRLLVTRAGSVLVRQRGDGKGLDLPSRRVGEEGVDQAVRSMEAIVMGSHGQAVILGWVRNVVAAPDSGYRWPAPEAYFAVWHAEVGPDPGLEGTWLSVGDAESQLGERHWWPLAEHAGVGQ